MDDFVISNSIKADQLPDIDDSNQYSDILQPHVSRNLFICYEISC